MKLVLLAVLALIVVTINGNPLSRHCKCSAVTEKLHVTYHSWPVSSCKLCSCNDAAMKNCEAACKALVQSYALTGCGKAIKGDHVQYQWDAGSCTSGTSTEKFTCN